MKKDWFYYLLLVIAASLWGSSFIFTKRLLLNASPITIIFSRVLIASIVFLCICFVFFREKMKIEKKDIPIIIAFSCFEPFLYFIFETYSLTYCDASVVSVIIATIPIGTAFLSLLYFKENFSHINLLGVFITFFGIFTMLFPSFTNASVSVKGILLAFGAVTASMGYTFFVRKFPEHYHPVVVITYQNLIGLLLFTPLMLILYDKQIVVNELSALFFTSNIYYVGALAILCSAFAFMFYLQGIRRFGIGKSSIFTNFIPIVTAILSFIILGESFPHYKILGIIIVIVGIFLVQQKKKPDRQ